MKNLLKSLLFLFILGGIGLTTAQAQNYDKAVGLRYTDFGAGLTGKMFVNETAAIEVILSYRSYGSYSSYSSSLLGVMGLYEIHKDLDNVLDGLQWYYGGGAYFSNYSYKYDSDFFEDYNHTTIGIVGVLGLEYKFEDLPITLSTDWLPSFGIGDWNDGLYIGNGGGSIRYTF